MYLPLYNNNNSNKFHNNYNRFHNNGELIYNNNNKEEVNSLVEIKNIKLCILKTHWMIPNKDF